MLRDSGQAGPQKRSACGSTRGLNEAGKMQIRLQRGQKSSGNVEPRQETEICNFGAPSALAFFELFLQSVPKDPAVLKILRRINSLSPY